MVSCHYSISRKSHLILLDPKPSLTEKCISGLSTGPCTTSQKEDCVSRVCYSVEVPYLVFVEVLPVKHVSTSFRRGPSRPPTPRVTSVRLSRTGTGRFQDPSLFGCHQNTGWVPCPEIPSGFRLSRLGNWNYIHVHINLFT